MSQNITRNILNNILFIMGNCTRSISWFLSMFHEEAVQRRFYESRWISCLVPDAGNLLGKIPMIKFCCTLIWVAEQALRSSGKHLLSFQWCWLFAPWSRRAISDHQSPRKRKQHKTIRMWVLIFLFWKYDHYPLNKTYHFDKAFTIQGTVMWFEKIADIWYGPLIRWNCWLPSS